MPPIDSLIFYDLMLSPTRDILISILLLVCAAMAYAAWRKTKSVFIAHALLGMGLVYFTVIVLCGISCVSTPVITSRIRYVVPMLACMWLGTLVVCNAIPRLRILMSLLVCFVSLSEARSFLYVNEKGRQEAASFRDFLSHNEPAEIIIPVYKSSQELAAWYLRSPLIIGNKPCRLLCSEAKVNDCTEDESDAMERTKMYAKNNKLPSFLLPLLYSYRKALHTINYELDRSDISNVDIERMLKEQKNVYSIVCSFRDNMPDMEATSKILAESNIRLSKTPVLSFKINCGMKTVLLYKLDLK